MSDAGAKSRWRKLRNYFLLLVLAGLVALAGLAWYATTDAFQAMVRRRLVAELEKITGGRVELAGVHTVPFRFRVEVRDLTIHGREAENETPYAHVDRLTAEVKIISVLGAEFGFHSIDFDHPVVHLIVYPDGSTNQPIPKAQKHSGQNLAEPLFALSISRLSVRRGELLWNDQKIPLDFVVNDVMADMSYSILRQHYEGKIAVGKIDTTIERYRPFSWTVEASFSLGKNDVVVRSLKAASDKSKLVASGSITNFLNPKIIGRYDATLDLGDAAAILRRPEVRRGSAHLDGTGVWSSSDTSLKGEVLLKDFDWQNHTIRLRNVLVAAEFSVDQMKLAFSQIQGRVLGGNFAGNAEVTNWQTNTRVNGSARGKIAAEQKGTVRLRVKDVSVPEIAGAFSTDALPLNRVNLAGTSNGSVELRWQGSPLDSELEVSADVVPSAHPAPGQLPVTAHGSAIYRPRLEELQVADLVVTTPASQIRAAGDLSSNSSLRISASTSDLREWKVLLAMLHSPEPFPVELHGRAAFTGTTTGNLAQAALAGNLSANDFESLVPATAYTPAKRVHWDSLNADVRIAEYGFSARNGRLQHDDTAIGFDVSANLTQGQFLDDNRFTAKVDMQNADVAEILAAAGKNYPASGNLNLSIVASGTKADPEGNGRIQLNDAVVHGEPIQSFDSLFSLGGGQVSLQQLHLTYRGASVTGDAGYSWGAHAIRANLAGTNFALGGIPQLQASRISIEGQMDFKARVSGTTEQPSVDGTVQLRDLVLDHERIGNFTLNASSHGPDVTISGRSQFDRASLLMDGTIALRGDLPVQMNVHFDQFDVHPLLDSYLGGYVSGISPLSGDAKAQGMLRHPRDATITANLNDFHTDVEGVKVRNDGPLRFSLAQQILKIDQARLVGEGTDVSADGTVQLQGDHQLDLHTQGRVNLKLLESYNAGFTSSGDLAMTAALSGTAASPVVQGRLQISGGSIAYIDLPSALSDINGSIVFNRNRAEVESLTAHVGGGLITFRGFAASYNRQFNFDLGMTGQDVRLRYPPGVSSTANLELKFAGSSSGSLLSGDITVNKLGMTPGFDFGGYLQRSAQAASLPQTNPLLNKIRLDVHVVTAPELQMQTAVVRLSGDADLHLRGTAAKPVLLGRADVIEGEAYLNGTKYRLERGDVNFTSPVTTTPVLDLQASTRIRDYDITLNVNGEMDKLNVTYRAEPPLPTADIIALLAFGQTTEESAQLQQQNNSAFSSGASSALIGEALNATVSNRVQRLFGVSRIKIDPQGFATETSPTSTGPAVTIEQQVKNNLTVTYTTNVSQASQQIIQVEYNVTRNVSIVALRDQNGVLSFVAKIRRRKQ